MSVPYSERPVPWLEKKLHRQDHQSAQDQAQGGAGASGVERNSREGSVKEIEGVLSEAEENLGTSVADDCHKKIRDSYRAWTGVSQVGY